MAATALILASTPWTGERVAALDGLAPAWPVAPMLALAALAMARARGPAVIALAAIVLCGVVVLDQPRPDGGRESGLRLRVVTHNVWVENVDPAGTVASLIGSGADLLLLQETDGRFNRMLPALRARFPYGSPCRGRCSLAILSRYPLDRVRYRFRDRAGRPFGPGLVQTRVHLPNGAIVPVATIHLSRNQPRDIDRRRRVALADAVQRTGTAAMILAGDLNLVPWSARLRSLDRALLPMHRTTAAFSYPARWRGRDVPFPLVPIDHLYVGPAWTVASTQQLPRTGSDHYPIAVDLIWRGAGTMVGYRQPKRGHRRGLGAHDA